MPPDFQQWKKRNVLQKAPETWQKKIKPRYYNFEDTYPSAGYTPPSFTGSLGKPTHSSTSMPRQVRIRQTIKNPRNYLNIMIRLTVVFSVYFYYL